MVWLHVPSIGRHRVKKLSKLWNGPYKIVKVLSPLNVVLKIRKREVTVHVNRIKPCLKRPLMPPQPAACPRDTDHEDVIDGQNGSDGEVEGSSGSPDPPLAVI